MNGFDIRSVEFRQFLVAAKLAGYATAGEGGERDSNDRGKEFRFSDGGRAYRDRYFGFNPFAGEEVVWHGKIPVWIMNYYGSVNSPDLNPPEVLDFLKQAMQQITVDRPYRGPEMSTEGDLEYRAEGSGDIGHGQLDLPPRLSLRNEHHVVGDGDRPVQVTLRPTVSFCHGSSRLSFCEMCHASSDRNWMTVFIPVVPAGKGNWSGLLGVFQPPCPSRLLVLKMLAKPAFLHTDKTGKPLNSVSKER